MDARPHLPLTQSKLLSGLSEERARPARTDDGAGGVFRRGGDHPAVGAAPARVPARGGPRFVRRSAGSDEVTLAELTAGDFFGEMAVMRSTPAFRQRRCPDPRDHVSLGTGTSRSFRRTTRPSAEHPLQHRAPAPGHEHAWLEILRAERKLMAWKEVASTRGSWRR